MTSRHQLPPGDVHKWNVRSEVHPVPLFGVAVAPTAYLAREMAAVELGVSPHTLHMSRVGAPPDTKRLVTAFYRAVWRLRAQTRFDFTPA